MGNDGKLKKGEKGSFPLPMGGPEPSTQGNSGSGLPSASANMGMNSVPIDVGYDHSTSRPGVSSGELAQGYCNRESITDACKSDGMEEA